MKEGKSRFLAMFSDEYLGGAMLQRRMLNHYNENPWFQHHGQSNRVKAIGIQIVNVSFEECAGDYEVLRHSTMLEE